jgi:hypothetical protein
VFFDNSPVSPEPEAVLKGIRPVACRTAPTRCGAVGRMGRVTQGGVATSTRRSGRGNLLFGRSPAQPHATFVRSTGSTRRVRPVRGRDRQRADRTGAQSRVATMSRPAFRPEGG